MRHNTVLQLSNPSAELDQLRAKARVVCLPHIARHQMVYRTLGERVGREIHALSMRTLTPAEYETAQRNG